MMIYMDVKALSLFIHPLMCVPSLPSCYMFFPSTLSPSHPLSHPFPTLTPLPLSQSLFFPLVFKVVLKEAKDAQESIGSYRQRLEDDIMGVKESYFALIKLCYETETWHRLLKGHIKSLVDFNNRRSRSQGDKG